MRTLALVLMLAACKGEGESTPAPKAQEEQFVPTVGRGDAELERKLTELRAQQPPIPLVAACKDNSLTKGCSAEALTANARKLRESITEAYAAVANAKTDADRDAAVLTLAQLQAEELHVLGMRTMDIQSRKPDVIK